MWIRAGVLLICTLFFINGCSSLASQWFGTHKLRTLSSQEVVTRGLGDADFVQITDVHYTDDYIIVPDSKRWGDALLLYPVMATSHSRDTAIKPLFIAWTERFDKDCQLNRSCVPLKNNDITGLLRKPYRLKRKADELPHDRYIISDDIIWLEVDRAPLAWYWNLLMMLTAILFVYLFERRWQQQKV